MRNRTDRVAYLVHRIEEGGGVVNLWRIFFLG